jgi:hypothetical protein
MRDAEPLLADLENEGRKATGADLLHQAARIRDVLIDGDAHHRLRKSGAIQTDLAGDLRKHFGLDDLQAALVMRVLDAAQHYQPLTRNLLSSEYCRRCRP